MLELNNIKAQPGATQKPKRLGRGPGSGLGKTSGRGEKGQGARKSGNVRPGFEGGQTPLYRRIPKRGFKNFARRDTAILNLAQLEKLDPQAMPEITLAALQEAKVVRRRAERLAVLGVGELTKAFKIKAHRVSEKAKSQIEKAGGQIEIVVPPKYVREKKAK